MTGLRDALGDMRRRHGRLTPALVVDEARDPLHPLHARFEWDDTVAGEKWRREQARALIRSVAVTYVTAEGVPQRVRAFHAVRTPERHFDFQPVDVIANDDTLSELLRRDMEREWRALKQRWGRFEEFLAMVRHDVNE